MLCGMMLWHDVAEFVQPLHPLSIIFHISVPRVLFFGYIFIFYDTAIIIEAVVFCSNNIYKKTLILQPPPPPRAVRSLSNRGHFLTSSCRVVQ